LDNIKQKNICIIGVPKEEKADKLFEDTIDENLPHLGKETDLQVQEVQRSTKDEPKEVHTTNSN